MKKYSELEVGDFFVIPSGTQFFSIALQENVISTRDMLIKITNTCVPENNYVFGIIQLIFHNPQLTAIFGSEDARGYSDKAHGDIGIGYDKLIDYNIDYNIKSLLI